MFKSVFDNLSFGVAIVDETNKILQYNKPFSLFFNLGDHNPISSLDQLHGNFKEQHISAFQKKNKFTTSEGNILSILAKPLEDNLWLLEVEDISTQEKESEDIYFRANYDQLTKLPNRELFNDRCKQALSSAHRHQENVAIFFIDVDDFKSINDTYGHDVGDSILLETAKRLSDSVRESDTVSRWAGDEFSILLPKIGEKENINHLLARMIESFEKPQQAKEFSIPVSLSIGISLAPKMGTDFDELMRFADKAMYEAKKNDGIYYKYYSE
ncbi:MAG: GGDEF domain-containing protein [Candidatus Marinimicrobia bacterium]|nr:GGDEF domain-containing protein [Candidatus Neomarinimicrobiota bacterium]